MEDYELAVGRIVHVTPATGEPILGCRPAIVVHVWEAPPGRRQSFNGVRFLDGINDGGLASSLVDWVTSVMPAGYGEGQSWHPHDECPG